MPKRPRSISPSRKGASDVIVDAAPEFDINDVGPHPGFIEPCQRYVYEHHIEKCLRQLGTEGTKEDQFRIQGVMFIDQVRKALGLPTKTLNTAAVIFHRFRLRYSLEQYTLSDAAASALYLASKIEDTAKRPNQIICAAYNVNLPVAEQRQPDDDFFDSPSDRLVDLERLMLESITFEFDTRHPQDFILRILQVEFKISLDDPEGKAIIYAAWEISMDLNLTFSLLKQSISTMGIACAELALRLHGRDEAVASVFPTPSKISPKISSETLDDPKGDYVVTEDPDLPFRRFNTTRAAVMETQMDLLDLYTTHRTTTFAGPKFQLDKIMQVRIALNAIVDQFGLPRYTHCDGMQNARRASIQGPQYVQDLKLDNNDQSSNAAGAANGSDGPADKLTNGNGNSAREPDSGTKDGQGDKGGPPLEIVAVKRFILKPAHAVQEIRNLDGFYLTREEEYEKEHEVDDGWETAPEDEDEDRHARKEHARNEDVRMEDVNDFQRSAGTRGRGGGRRR